MLNVHGKGRCAITLDPQDKSGGAQPYQGVVALHGDAGEPLQALSAVLEHYMLQSEQLDTRLMLAADDECAAGLLIQRLPVEGEGNLARRHREDEIGINEAFNRIAHLTATLTREELLTLDADTLLRRLYWEEDLRRFEPLQPHFSCRCSRDRVRGMLRGLGAEEVEGHRRRARRGRDRLRVLRPAVPLRCGRRRRAVHARAGSAAGLSCLAVSTVAVRTCFKSNRIGDPHTTSSDVRALAATLPF